MAYCKKLMRHPFLILGVSSLLVVGAAVAMLFSQSGTVAYNTVEINLAEVSPKGEAGGYAIPASGNSYGCTIYGLPATMYQGQTFYLYYSPNMAMNVTRNGVSRGTTASSPWGDSTSSGLATGTYTYALSGLVPAGEHCTSVNTYCNGDPKNGVFCTSECAGWAMDYDTYSCSGTLTVAAAPNIPNLISVNLQIPGNPAYIPTSVPISLTARVENTGTVDTSSSFVDVFRFYTNPSGPWQHISTTTHSGGINAGAFHLDTSSNVTFWTPGTQLVGHCVDQLDQISESTNTDNCSQRLYTVASALSASCSASPSSADEGDTVTWTASASGGSGGYSYQWSGTDSLSGSGASIQKAYANSGTKTASVIVTDGYGRSSGWVACSTSVSVEDDDPSADIQARVLGSGSAWSDGPITIAATDEVELRWSSQRASSCTGDTYYSTGGATSGSTGVVSEAVGGQSRTYRVTCSDGSSSDNDTVQVNRNVPTSPPTLVADPDRVRQGETTNLTGNLNGHSGCTITGGTTNISVPDGTNAFSYTSGSIMGETVITLNCALGEASDTVRILPAVEHF